MPSKDLDKIAVTELIVIADQLIKASMALKIASEKAKELGIDTVVSEYVKGKDRIARQADGFMKSAAKGCWAEVGQKMLGDDFVDTFDLDTLAKQAMSKHQGNVSD